MCFKARRNNSTEVELQERINISIGPEVDIMQDGPKYHKENQYTYSSPRRRQLFLLVLVLEKKQGCLGQ